MSKLPYYGNEEMKPCSGAVFMFQYARGDAPLICSHCGKSPEAHRREQPSPTDIGAQG